MKIYGILQKLSISKSHNASRSLTILENLLAGLLMDFRDLINTQRSKHTMHNIV